MPKHKTTAIEKLQPSRLLGKKQLELLGGDVDIDDFHLQVRRGCGVEIDSAITDAVADRTVEGASTLTVTVDDNDDREIQTSGSLGRRVDVNVDGLWWTLVSVKKTGRRIDLVFEEREVNVLRRYNKPLFNDRSKITRAQFVLRMIREVKETQLRWVIPELHVKQIISDTSKKQILVGPDGTPINVSDPKLEYDSTTQSWERHKGINKNAKLTVKHAAATQEQINNANIILGVGDDMNAPRKVMVCSIMTAIAESTIHNLTAGQSDAGSVGVFQQRKDSGWPATRNVAIDARAFFQNAIIVNTNDPDLSYNDLCQAVQHSGVPNGYAPWQDEALAFVDKYDRAPTTAEADAMKVANNKNSKANMWVRGTITKAQGISDAFVLEPENSWNCMQRLAQEVNWRCFCVSGTIYFISDEWLFKSKPFMVISEDSPGIDWIDYDYDEGKPIGTCEVTAHIGRWSAPPGSIVEITDMGPIDGKWLVSDVSRSLFDTKGTITLEKPLPKLPEPVSLSSIPSGFTGTPRVENDYGKSMRDANKTQQTVVAFARTQLGVPYQWGAELPGVAFDCSGLSEAAYNSAGIDIPRVAQDQYDAGRKLFKESLLPGDLVFFGTSTTGITHVGIYIGGGNMIDAPHSGAVVRVDKNFMNWTNPKFVGATRPWQKGR